MSVVPGKEYLRKEDYEVRPIPIKAARELVEKYHYAKGASKTATHLHGLFIRGCEECVGVAWWLPPTKVAAQSVYPEDFTKVVSLSRLVISPGLPTNAATFLLSRSIRLIKKEGKYKALVTYADTWRGHTGAIYKASNWEYLGLMPGKPTWIDPETGRMVAVKATRTRSVAEMRELGYRKAGVFPKHKYRILLEGKRGTP